VTEWIWIIQVLDFELKYYTRRFVESFHINSDEDAMKEKGWTCSPIFTGSCYNSLH